jgi:hypothetical protein
MVYAVAVVRSVRLNVRDVELRGAWVHSYE